MKSLRVLQIVDCLNAAGKERVAVNLANLVQGAGNQSYLCTTRMDGPLETQIDDNVGRLRLARRRRYEISALYRLIAYIQKHEINILHAHDTSLWIAALASIFPPYPAVVWHDHDGLFGLYKRPELRYRLGAIRLKAIIAVSQSLAEWAQTKLHMPAERIWYLPNFVCPSQNTLEASNVPGISGARIACVAAFRRQKDHVTLLRAMALVVQKVPTAHLLLLGATRGDQEYLDLILETIANLNLTKNVSLLGERQDVNAILRACNIGVLSSAGEAFPLALLEYGLAGLPSIVTRVGQCAEILDEGRVGLLVPPGSPDQLAEGLIGLLNSPTRRATLGEGLKHQVEEFYSTKRALKDISKVYDRVLEVDKP